MNGELIFFDNSELSFAGEQGESSVCEGQHRTSVSWKIGLKMMLVTYSRLGHIFCVTSFKRSVFVSNLSECLYVIFS